MSTHVNEMPHSYAWHDVKTLTGHSVTELQYRLCVWIGLFCVWIGLFCAWIGLFCVNCSVAFAAASFWSIPQKSPYKSKKEPRNIQRDQLNWQASFGHWITAYCTWSVICVITKTNYRSLLQKSPVHLECHLCNCILNRWSSILRGGFN